MVRAQRASIKHMMLVHTDELRVVICGSISAASQIRECQLRLEREGFIVDVPAGVSSEFLRLRTDVSTSEKAADKKTHNLIRSYFFVIQRSDAVFVVNPERRGVPGYIGGNTFLEMGFAHVLHKPLFIWNPVPDMPYSSEIMAMEPVVLASDVDWAAPIRSGILASKMRRKAVEKPAA